MSDNSGDRIKNIRKHLGLSQKEFSKRIGYSQGFLAELERGKKQPSRDFLEKLSEEYGLSSDYILFGEKKWDAEKMLYATTKERIIKHLKTLDKIGAIPKNSISPEEFALLKVFRNLPTDHQMEILEFLVRRAHFSEKILLDDKIQDRLQVIKRVLNEGFIRPGVDHEAEIDEFEELRKSL